jgi:hypothetical protein
MITLEIGSQNCGILTSISGVRLAAHWYRKLGNPGIGPKMPLHDEEER